VTETRRTVVKATGDGRAVGPGGFVNTGVIDGDVVLPSVRAAISGYLHQVRRLSAPRFQGRKQELAAMADFCSAEEAIDGSVPSWWRWLAPAWAGKTALMAEFVLNPPPNVAVISFFITARLAGQNTRTAFCEVVQRQLYAFLDEEEPPVTEHTRDELLLHALERAASKCTALGKRLILVVDGLDEDRSVDIAHGGHSIAALLPARPPHGTRVIVAGRPHPPIPRDVHPEHPLRSDKINHRLVRSRDAAAIRVEAENSLDELVEKGGLAFELLGLVAAAGGGLSAADLADLTHMRQLRIRRTLDGIIGRIFLTSPSVWALGDEVYLLGHEEIQNAALEILSTSEIAEYRRRILCWADRYQEENWPAETPEYLLRGYPQLLRSIEDLGRLSTIACNSDRHERLWRMTGSDLDALVEVATALDLHQVKAQDGYPDVVTSLLLAMARDALRNHTSNAPEGLVVAWAILGDTDRAINLALSYSDHARQIRTLASAAKSLLKAGEADTALLFADLSVEFAQSSTDPEVRASAFADSVGIFAQAGQSQKAEKNAARSLAIVSEFSSTPLRVKTAAQIVSSIGYDDQECSNVLLRALEDARSIDESAAQATMLIQISQAMAKIGRSDEAFHLANDAHEITHAVLTPDSKVSLFCRISEVMTSLERYEVANVLIKHASKALASIYNPEKRSRALAEIAEALSESGQSPRALNVAEQITEQESRSKALSCIARNLARAGDHLQAEKIARTISAPSWRAQGLAFVAEATAQEGRLERAIALAYSIDMPSWRAQALAEIAVNSGYAGKRSDAERIAAEAAEAARDVIEPAKLHRALTDVAEAILDTDTDVQAIRLVDRATELARGVSELGWQARALARAASLLAQAGQHERAVALATEAAEIAHGSATDRPRAFHDVAVALAKAEELNLARETVAKIRDFGLKPLAIGEIVYANALAGNGDEALDLTGSITDPGWRARTLASVAGVMERSGNTNDAVQAVQDALKSASQVRDPRWRTRVLAEIAETIASAGARPLAALVSTEAVETARIVQDLEGRVESLAKSACALASAGEYAEATRIAAETAEATRVSLPPESRSRVLTQSAIAIARTGQHEQALAMINHIKEPGRRGRALAKVAGEFGSSLMGRRALIEALQLLPWVHTCDVLARVAPDAAQAAALRLLNGTVAINSTEMSVSDLSS
jgi:tetratricopeptide (TPR) repeat protein